MTEETKTKIWNKIKQAFNFIMRNLAWIIMGLVCYLLLNPGIAEIRTILFLSIIEAAAISLSGLAMFAYTKINFTKKIIEDDNNITEAEHIGSCIVLGLIFLGVHILTGLVVLGYYIAQIGI